jgi:hypothetical protein
LVAAFARQCVQSIGPITCVSLLRYQSQGARYRSSSRLQSFDAHEIVPDAHLKRECADWQHRSFQQSVHQVNKMFVL